MAKNEGAQYDDAIQFAAKEFGVNPDILHGIAYAESRYNANTPPSSAGAQGMMQFMPGTAKRFGIDPKDPEQAIFAAAKYLKDNLTKFNGDYAKAIAGYNWGENRKVFDREDWAANLPKETDKYVEDVLTYAGSRAKPAEAAPTGAKPAFPGSKAHLIPGAENDILPTPRKEMGLVERVKDIGKGLVEIPGAIIGGTIREPIAAGVALATGRKPEEIGGQIAPVQSEFAKSVLGGLGSALETAKVPALTPGMLTAPVRPAIAAGRQVAPPIANNLAKVTGAVSEEMAARNAIKSGERAAQSFREAPRIEAAQEANRLGINLNPAASNPTMRNRLKEAMVGGEYLDKLIAESDKHQWSKIAKDELGISQQENLADAATFAKARQAVSKPYEDIKKIDNFAGDQSTIDALNELVPSESLIGGQATHGAIKKLVDDAVTRVQGGLTGKDLLDNISNLRKDARTIYKRTDISPEQRAIADTNLGIANTLESLIENNLADNPKLLEQFRDARAKMAKSYAYESATDKNTGFIDPLKIAQMTAKDNALTGDIAAIGKIAGNFPETVSTTPRSIPAKAFGHLTRSGVPGAIGFALGSALGSPAAGIITGALAGQVAARIGAKRVLGKGYQAKRAVPKDYRNNLAPIEKLNKLAK